MAEAFYVWILTALPQFWMEIENAMRNLYISLFYNITRGD